MVPARVLVIAGSDSGGGAGIQADIKTITMMGGFAMTAISALTAQNTLGVDAVMPVPAEMVLRQMDAVLSDLGADAVKIGMIGSSDTARALAHRLEQLSIPIVFDPVMVASSGAALADDATVAAFERLMEISTLTTPNVPELAVLLGEEIGDLDELEAGALALSRRTGSAILAKGGHLPSKVITDVLVEKGGEVHRWEAERVETLHTHGTGCTLASGIASGLGQGRALPDAVTRARDYLQAAIRAAPAFGAGHGPIGHGLGTMPFHGLEKLRG
jgi:hydroxymethylpyrimidine/phosphomethylpyrimidine kinase